METKKNSGPNSEVKKSKEKSKKSIKQNSNTGAKVKRVTFPTKEARECITPPVRSTLIPVPKSEASKTSDNPTKSGNVKYTLSCPLERDMQNEELDEKLRLLEAKEKSIAEYYEKIKDINEKVLELQNKSLFFDGSKSPRTTVSSTTSLPRRVVSDTEREGKNELLTSFEKSIHQISDIWLKTSSDLSSILNSFRNSPTFSSDEIQVENSKLQLAIKHAKSLTLIKTKSAIAEAKRLLNAKEDNGDDRGDSSTKLEGKRDGWSLSTLLSKVSSGELIAKKSTTALSNEQAKKNETITLLNNKIFELQKACNEHLLENSQLQYKIAEMNEKSQWNQVFWKQLSKLKDRIKLLQQNNRQLEGQKKEMELKMANMSVEMDKMSKLNQMLRQQINIWHYRQANAAREEAKKLEQEAESSITAPPSLTNTFVIRGKEDIIEDLKNILIVMKGQENFAHQKISEFETKIEEFKQYHS